MLINIVGEDYLKCLTASTNYWANGKGGNYGRGLGRTDEDPFKPVRTGMLGEMAFSFLSGLPVDFEYKENGDKHDFILDGKTVDVKCAMKNYKKCLVYARSESGKEIPLVKDIYVFGYIHNEVFGNHAEVMLMGWLPKEDVAQCPIRKGLRGRHYNYEVAFTKTKKIEELIP